MGDLCSCWDAIHNVMMLQHNEIRASFERSLHVKTHDFNIITYKKLVGVVSRVALVLIANEVDRVKNIGFDSELCGCMLRQTYGLPCACVLARYDVGVIPLGEIHIMWSRLSFSDILSAESILELGIQQEINLLTNRYKEVDITGKVTIKHKLREIVCPEQTSMIAPMHKVKTKGAQKTRAYRFERSTKRDPSYFEHVDAFHDSHLGKKDSQSKAKARAKGTYESMQQK